MPKQRRIFEAEMIARGMPDKPARRPSRSPAEAEFVSIGNKKKPDDFLSREIVLRLIEWIKQI